MTALVIFLLWRARSRSRLLARCIAGWYLSLLKAGFAVGVRAYSWCLSKAESELLCGVEFVGAQVESGRGPRYLSLGNSWKESKLE